jgi:hypothetical protein
MLKLSPNWEECGPKPIFASYTLAFALQLRKKQGKTSARREKWELAFPLCPKIKNA